MSAAEAESAPVTMQASQAIKYAGIDYIATQNTNPCKRSGFFSDP